MQVLTFCVLSDVSYPNLLFSLSSTSVLFYLVLKAP